MTSAKVPRRSKVKVGIQCRHGTRSLIRRWEPSEAKRAMRHRKEKLDGLKLGFVCLLGISSSGRVSRDCRRGEAHLRCTTEAIRRYD